MLAIYTDAQKMTLDVRMVDPFARDYADSRLNQFARLIYTHWRESRATKGTQLVFCDFGKPASERTRPGFSAYDALIVKLVHLGIPAAQIAHVYQATTKTQRTDLFRRVNAGDIRVLIGSTQKMGIGTNVQERVVAMHHLTLPHRPADLEQREGRGLRQGNTNSEVAVYYGITEKSLDELKFANVVRKARAANQFMQGKSTIRTMEDIGDLTPSLEAFQAAASGDPRVRRKLEVDTEILRLSALHAAWKDERYNRKRHLHSLPDEIKRFNTRIANLQALVDAYTLHPKPDWTIGTTLVEPKHKAIALKLSEVYEVSKFVTATVYGLPFSIRQYHGAHIGGCEIDIRDATWLAVVERTEKLVVTGAPDAILKNKAFIQECEAEAKRLEVAVQATWPHENTYNDLLAEQGRLFKELGGLTGDKAAAGSEDGAVIDDTNVEAEDDEDDSPVYPHDAATIHAHISGGTRHIAARNH